MRHGEAGFAAGDRARPLTLRGREEAASQARAIARVVGGIDVAVVSEAARTQQTLAALRSAGLAVARVWEEASLYSRGGEGLLETLRGLDRCGIEVAVREADDVEAGFEADAVLVVGHEPTMSTLAGLLATREKDLHESQGRAPFRALRGAGATRADHSFRRGFSTAMAVVGHVESWSSLAPGCMRIADVLRP
jgi:phosphohistidine phosphatase, sixA